MQREEERGFLICHFLSDFPEAASILVTPPVTPAPALARAPLAPKAPLGRLVSSGRLPGGSYAGAQTEGEAGAGEQGREVEETP